MRSLKPVLPFLIAFLRASPAIACTCDAEPTPVGIEDLEPFDLIFSGIARRELPDGQHSCGSPDASEVAFEVEARSVWRGEPAVREVVVVRQDSCAPVVPLDSEIVIHAQRQGDGSASFTGLNCSILPTREELTGLLGEPSTTDRDEPMPGCFPSCASGPMPASPLLLLGLLSLIRRPRRAASVENARARRGRRTCS